MENLSMNHVNTKPNVLKTHPANTASYLSLRLGVTQVASTVPFREEEKKKGHMLVVATQ